MGGEKSDSPGSDNFGIVDDGAAWSIERVMERRWRLGTLELLVCWRRHDTGETDELWEPA